MKKIVILTAIIFMFSNPIVVTGQDEFSRLNSVKFEDNVLTIVTDSPVNYNIFKITNPPRLVVDLNNTE